jgi:hypothetical protein
MALPTRARPSEPAVSACCFAPQGFTTLRRDSGLWVFAGESRLDVFLGQHGDQQEDLPAVPERQPGSSGFGQDQHLLQSVTDHDSFDPAYRRERYGEQPLLPGPFQTTPWPDPSAEPGMRQTSQWQGSAAGSAFVDRIGRSRKKQISPVEVGNWRARWPAKRPWREWVERRLRTQPSFNHWHETPGLVGLPWGKFAAAPDCRRKAGWLPRGLADLRIYSSR